jgi:hypothetical protein
VRNVLGFSPTRAVSGNWDSSKHEVKGSRTPTLLPANTPYTPAPEPPVTAPIALGLVAEIGPEASRLFGSPEVDGIKNDWKLGRRASSHSWKWLARYGVTEAFRVVWAPEREQDLIGITLWIVKHTVQGGKTELIIATSADFMEVYVPRWKAEMVK